MGDIYYKFKLFFHMKFHNTDIVNIFWFKKSMLERVSSRNEYDRSHKQQIEFDTQLCQRQ